ncbi:MAG: DUF177 domain-containing protein [Alphaproteobacteria bacterium]|nr:DUF177 domain-containing protein [Alphaproteobacteria bacterium]
MRRNQGAPPLHQVFDLTNLSQAGTTARVTATGDDLARLAQWAGVVTVRSFEAVLKLRKLASTRFAYDAELTADIVQSCVLTLEPIESRIRRHILRELKYAPQAESAGELNLSAVDDDLTETIENLHYDITGPLQEEFILAIDPYPRAEHAAFALPPDSVQGRAESTFAVLKKLKEGH